MWRGGSDQRYTSRLQLCQFYHVTNLLTNLKYHSHRNGCKLKKTEYWFEQRELESSPASTERSSVTLSEHGSSCYGKSVSGGVVCCCVWMDIQWIHKQLPNEGFPSARVRIKMSCAHFMLVFGKNVLFVTDTRRKCPKSWVEGAI